MLANIEYHDVELFSEANCLEICQVIRGLGLLELLISSPSVAEMELIPKKRLSDSQVQSGNTTKDYAEAAVLCLRDDEIEIVENYFIKTGLASTNDMLRAIDSLSGGNYTRQIYGCDKLLG